MQKKVVSSNLLSAKKVVSSELNVFSAYVDAEGPYCLVQPYRLISALVNRMHIHLRRTVHGAVRSSDRIRRPRVRIPLEADFSS